MGSHRHSSNHSSNYLLLLLLLLAAAAAVLIHSASASASSGRSSSPVVVHGDSKTGLIGPGSSPPTCRSRCGRCWPCEPVHVPIQPGVSVPLEYYPEAWRCKCGNKIFMP